MNTTAIIIVGVILALVAVPFAWLYRVQIMAQLRKIRLPGLPTFRRTAPVAAAPAAAPTGARRKPTPPKRHHPDRSDPNGIDAWLDEHITYYTKSVEWKKAHHAENTPEVYEWLYFTVCGAVLAVAALLAAAVALWVPPVAFADWGFPLNPQWFFYLLIAVYLLAGFRMVDTDEVAGADFFGEPVYQFDSGLKWFPWLILGFNKEPTTYVQAEFPGDADHVQWSDEKTELAEGKVRPLYVVTGEKPATPGKPDDRLPTDLQMNIGVAEFVQFRLVKAHFFDLEVNIGDIDADKEIEIRRTITGGTDLTLKMLEAVRQMRDTSGAILLEVLGQLSLNEIRQYLTLINKLLELRLQEKVMDWGLELVDARITKTNAGHDFNEKLQNRGEAISVRDSTIIKAEGEKQRLILEGQGKASATQAELEATANGYQAIGEVVRLKKGREAMNGQVVAKLAEAGNVVVVGPQGITDMFGLVKAAQKQGEAKP